MAPTLTMVDRAKVITFIGIGPMTGYSLIIRKDGSVVDVHQIAPVALSGGMTWQLLSADLIARLT